MEIVATYVPQPGVDPREEIATPPPGATMVEIRADLLADGPALESLVAASPLPVVATLRSRAEGGGGPDEPAAREAFFAGAAGCGAAFVDIEGGRDAALLGRLIPRERAIASTHFPAGLPRDLEQRTAALLSLGTRFVKVVPAARGVADVAAVLRLADALGRGRPESRRGIVFAAGESGRVTRLLAPLVGAPIAYAAWSAGRGAAPGQLTAEEIRALTGHLDGRPRRLFAVLGARAAASLSPRMHAAAYRAAGLPYLFAPIEVSAEEELDLLLAPAGEGALDGTCAPTGGFAVTMPWKRAGARRCSVLAPRARRAGVVNTVLPRPGKVLGDCTDIDGIARVLAESGVEVAGAPVGVVGSGGAARAAAVGLALAGATVLVAARDTEKGRAMARDLGAAAVAPSEMGGAVAVINATPAGADGAPSPLLEGLALAEGALAVDLPYGEDPTFLALLAARRGWRYVSGREVLLYQGVSQFAAMCGVAPPVRAMAAALGLAELDA